MGTRYGIWLRAGTDTTPYSATEAGIQCGSNGDVYPVTRQGLTFGWVGGFPTPVAQAAWEAGDDARLANTGRVTSPATNELRADLPEGAGEYDVWMVGSLVAFSNGRLRLFDGAEPTPLVDVSEAEVLNGAAIDQVWFPATASTPAQAAFGGDVYAIVAPIRVTLASAYLRLVFGGHAAGNFNTAIHGLAFEKVIAGGAGLSPAVLRRRRRQAGGSSIL